MYVLTYRLSIFGNFQRFSASSANVVAWTQALQKAGYEYIPSIFQPTLPFPNFPLPVAPNSKSDRRIQFVSPQNDVFVRILAERIDIEAVNNNCDSYNTFFTDKLQQLLHLTETTLSFLDPDLSGTRLAYYVDSLIPESDNQRLTSFYNRYNLGLTINSSEDNCVEWSHRFNHRVNLSIGDVTELCNAIILVESGTLQNADAVTQTQTSIRGLHVSADINTLAERTVNRFHYSDLASFVSSAQNTFINLLNQITQKFYE